MRKEDFHKGQTVWVYLVGNSARGKKTVEQRIQEWEVVSVGRKYITARPKGRTGTYFNEKFEIENNFNHVYTYGSANYVLYLSKEDILQDVWRSQTRVYIRHCARWGSPITDMMSDEDLQTVSEILRKYDKDGDRK